MKAILYAAKSSEDEKGSIETQLEDGRKLAADHGYEVIEAYRDVNKSAFHGNRGPDLTRAMAHCEQLGSGTALIVQHSDRLARGDGRDAKHLLHYALWAMERGIAILSVQDPGTFDLEHEYGLVMAALGGTRNTQDSSRKSKSVKDGLTRRREKGDPVGAMPGIGYVTVPQLDENGQVMVSRSGKVVNRRVVDEDMRAVVVEMFERVAGGQSLGTVARWLNAQGIKTRRDAVWVARTVRNIIDNSIFEGEKGYPAIVDADLAGRARRSVQRLDPVAVQRRIGGRPRKEPYLLRSLAFCAQCGAPMYLAKNYHRNGSYVCARKLEHTGLCGAQPIPAQHLEAHVLNHLSTFIESVEDWIAGRVRERDKAAEARQSQLDAEKAQLAILDRQRAARLREIAEHGITSPVALEIVESIDAEREAQAQRIAEAEALLSEFTGPADVDAALDFYNELVRAIDQRVSQAPGVRELNEALCGVLAGLWCELDAESDYERLLVRFALRAPGGPPKFRMPDGEIVELAPALRGSWQPVGRLWLPPIRVDREPLYPPLETPETMHITTVSACCR